MKVTLSITFDQVTGALTVEGPIGLPILAYGMLEGAKDMIRMQAEKAGKAGPSLIQPAQFIPPVR